MGILQETFGSPDAPVSSNKPVFTHGKLLPFFPSCFLHSPSFSLRCLRLYQSYTIKLPVGLNQIHILRNGLYIWRWKKGLKTGEWGIKKGPSVGRLGNTTEQTCWRKDIAVLGWNK